MSKKALLFLAFYGITGTFIYIFCVTFIKLPFTGVKYADMAVPFLLGAIVGTVFTFAFGSSGGSKEKDDALNKALDVNKTLEGGKKCK